MVDFQADADALNAIAADRDLQARLRHRRQEHRLTILTPHPLEAARLLGTTAAAVQSDRPHHVQTLATQLGCHVVLKGSGTLVASPDGNWCVNPTGNARLATAGTGDVLAGLLVGLLAQGVPAFEAASMAVWMHGEAGAEAGPGLIAEDLPEAMPEVFRRLYDLFAVEY